MISSSLALVIIVLCIMFSAYFSATETAFSSLNRVRMKNLAEKGNKKAKLVLELSEQFDSMLSSILIGNNVVNIACASLATILFVNQLGEEIGASISTLVTTVVVLIFGEVSPKGIAKESPEKFAMFSAPILKRLMMLLKPFNYLFTKWNKLLNRLIKTQEEQGITEDELLTMVEEAEHEGGIDKEEGTLIRSAIEFSDMEAIDIFTPRVKVVGIPDTATAKEIAEVFVTTGFSRLPVYEDTIDNIVGILHQKDFYSSGFPNEVDVKAIMKPPIYTIKNKKIDKLLKELQVAKSHMAVIIDEFGGTVGIVTLEDILEELVGEIWDEHDKVQPDIQRVSENEYVVRGCTNIEKLFSELHINQEVDVQSVNGWIVNMLGRMPKEGENFTFGQYEFSVIKVLERRVEAVYVKIKNTLLGAVG